MFLLIIRFKYFKKNVDEEPKISRPKEILRSNRNKTRKMSQSSIDNDLLAISCQNLFSQDTKLISDQSINTLCSPFSPLESIEMSFKHLWSITGPEKSQVGLFSSVTSINYTSDIETRIPSSVSSLKRHNSFESFDSGFTGSTVAIDVSCMSSSALPSSSISSSACLIVKQPGRHKSLSYLLDLPQLIRCIFNERPFVYLQKLRDCFTKIRQTKNMLMTSKKVIQQKDAQLSNAIVKPQSILSILKKLNIFSVFKATAAIFVPSQSFNGQSSLRMFLLRLFDIHFFNHSF